LNFPFYISKRIRKSSQGSFSSSIHRIAVVSIGVGLAIMIISFLILFGFQNTVKEKLFGFSGHLQITKYTLSNSVEELPISNKNDFYLNYKNIEGIRHVQQYAYKHGLIRTKEEILGVVMKGVDTDFDIEQFSENMVAGEFLKVDTSSYSKQVVISQVIANKLNLSLGDQMTIHFFQNPPRARRLTISGIYETNLSEYFDDKVILADMGLIRRLNNWADSLSGGYEVYLDDYRKMEQVESKLDDTLDYNLFVENISDKYVQVFDWLYLIRRQVNIFLGLILCVVCFNMISIILILIMERTQMIGMFKALGATNKQVRMIFNYSGLQLLGKGLLLGNAIGLSLCAIQYFFHVIPLEAKDYYMSYVPISWDWDVVLILNLLTLVVVYAILAIPTLLIVRIRPIKAIRFD
jgi:lipoprotein-releasing system permease protein